MATERTSGLRTLRLGLAAGLMLAAFAASAQMYRWVDEKGRVNFTATPPPPGAKNVQKREAAPAAAAQPGAGQPFALQQAMRNAPVTLYSTPGCEGCDAARKLLNERGVPFKEVAVSDDASMAELRNASGGTNVPTMLVGRSAQQGFEAGNYNRALDAAGYPRAGILPARNAQPPAAQAPAGAEPAAGGKPPVVTPESALGGPPRRR